MPDCKRYFAAALLLLAAGCATSPEPGSSADSSATNAGTMVFLPANDPQDPAWRRVDIRFKTPTQYSAANVDGVRCIRAQAEASWSFRVADVPGALHNASRLSWRWHVPALLRESDNEHAGMDDAPARVVVAFKGDRAKLDAAERATMSLARALGGIELPYASIQYIVENDAPLESVIANANSARVKKIVVQSGALGLNQWLSFERNVRADFRRAFPGEEPGDIESIGLMTDTDSLGGKAEACYADIALR